MKITIYGYHKSSGTAERIVRRSLPSINIKFNHAHRDRGLMVEIDEISQAEERSQIVRKIGGVHKLGGHLYQVLAA